MNFEKILNDIEKNKLLIGYNENKNCEIDLNNSSSIIITGETGTGKSILLDQILLELIKSHTSLEMGLILIDTSGVELNYYVNTNYTLLSAINNMVKCEEVLFKILREIERRKKLLFQSKVLNVDDYNKINKFKLPMLVIAIDDDRCVLHNRDVGRMIKGIISQIKDLNIKLILSTSDLYNDFFEHDDNTLADVLISFDYTSNDESIRNNINNSQNLNIGAFICKDKNGECLYHNFQFDNKIIDEILK